MNASTLLFFVIIVQVLWCIIWFEYYVICAIIGFVVAVADLIPRFKLKKQGKIKEFCCIFFSPICYIMIVAWGFFQ